MKSLIYRLIPILRPAHWPFTVPPVKIPHGYVLVTSGLTQRGDGRLSGKRFLKVRPEYPPVRPGEVIIRPAKVEQQEIPETKT